jgi:hypothetical protein
MRHFYLVVHDIITNKNNLEILIDISNDTYNDNDSIDFWVLHYSRRNTSVDAESLTPR